jgi:hypothetical protein
VPDHTGATVVLCRRRQCRREGAERVQALVDTPPTGPIAVAWDHAVPQVDEAIAARVRAAAGRLVLLYWATYSPWLHPIERRWRPFRREVTHGALLASLEPPSLNQPWASTAVIVMKACWIACSRASRVHALAVRQQVLRFDQAASVGARSGEYGGTESSHAPP